MSASKTSVKRELAELRRIARSIEDGLLEIAR